MKKVLFCLLVILAMNWMLQAQAPDPLEQAFQAAQSRWLGGFVQQVRLPGTDFPLYEVGRIEFFGRRLVLGRGGSWIAAFAQADEVVAKMPPF